MHHFGAKTGKHLCLILSFLFICLGYPKVTCNECHSLDTEVVSLTNFGLYVCNKLWFGKANENPDLMFDLLVWVLGFWGVGNTVGLIQSPGGEKISIELGFSHVGLLYKTC